jgi:predicted outer membrane repeat protein
MILANNSPGRIRNSTFEGIFEGKEGAIEIKNPKSNIVIENCYFTKNVQRFGGAIQYAHAGNNYLHNCTFKENVAENGGAISIRETLNVTIDNCTFERNAAVMSKR